MAHSKNMDERKIALNELQTNFAFIKDKSQATKDLLALTKDWDSGVRWHAAHVLVSAFPHITDKEQAVESMLALVMSGDSEIQEYMAIALVSVFPYITDKDRAWKHLLSLTWNIERRVRLNAVYTLGSAFSYFTDKDQAWKDLVALTQRVEYDVRSSAFYVLNSAFPHVIDKDQAWKDLLALTKDQDSDVRRRVADSLSLAFPHVTDKDQVTKDLLALTKDQNSDVRAYAYYFLGKVHIFKATEEDEVNFRSELEKALEFFEKSSQEQVFFNPAKFCLPFYRSLYSITFKKDDAKEEVQKYLTEAKSAVNGSENKGKLLEAVENLSNALQEAQKPLDFNEMKQDLNAYRRYCEHAADLLGTTEDKAPGATKLIKRGLPIINDRIKEILAEVQEKAKGLCRQTKGTAFENLGKDVFNAGQNILNVRDPIGLEKKVQNMQIALSAICAKMPEEDRGDACDLLKRANDELYIEDKIELINMVLSKIPSQIGKGKTMPNTINIVTQSGSGSKYYSESEDKSINITGLASDIENLKLLIERDYNREDKKELIQIVEQMKHSCNDSSKKEWLREKMGWLLTKTAEVSSISSLIITLLQTHLI